MSLLFSHLSYFHVNKGTYMKTELAVIPHHHYLYYALNLF